VAPERARQFTVLAVAFAVALLAIGVPYWRIPYAKLALPDALISVGLVVAFGAAAAVRFFGAASLWHAILVIGLAAPCAVLLRIVVGVIADPTSHNLWPFEVVLAAGVGFATSLCGALLGSALRLAVGRSTEA
jgi:hypothetical protein